MRKRWSVLFLAAAMAFTVLASGCGSGGGKESSMFSAMETVDLAGNEVDASLFAENDLTLVNIWATWCGPCVNEIPVLDQLSKEYEGTGVAIKGLLYEPSQEQPWGVSDSVRETAEQILSETGASYQQLTASEYMAASAELQSLMAYPTTYFVNAKGEVLGYVMRAYDYEGWKEVIDRYHEEALK